MTATARLSRPEFVHALRHGLGRARLDVRRHGLGDRLPLLVNACLHSQTMDRLVEGSLAFWLLQVADDGGAEQAVVALGERGWLHVARSFGRRAERLDVHRLSWVVHAAGKFVGRLRARAVLDRAAARDPAVARFRAAIDGELRALLRPRPERPVDASLERLEALVRGPRRRAASELHRWGRHASRPVLAEAWRRAAAETVTRRLRLRLSALDTERPPRSVALALRWAEHDDEFVRRWAARMLARARDPRVRRFALAELRRDPDRALRAGAARLLAKNGRATDHAVLLAALGRARERKARRDWAGSVVEISERRRGRAWDELLLRAWCASPCRFCRAMALDRLVRRGAAPRALLRESLWDADSDARRVARRALRG